ncbi:asparagine synthase (glutamine-hydrolyzing) [Paenibacillus hemerocallicola]|jgi:asparagine synthase (glutamine-hydrolysing)|uniref:asparagine synthase (glutamine-hydrolyzing) n=1 Tax=Paenibacillus hemerocallicola TaxID=1172614 RepID=A0A5C4TE33_9BACL|nr:asparagine synthase (glutamine-hydrolyzing) [Paenibacillus hemerocallicola]TNJ66709.1 asparagine synthase (glutamine-hydrolyzing) [Paenibacillus hemerocallicola]
MCGIAGFFERSGTRSGDEMVTEIVNMTEKIIHRGPNSSGFWVDPDIGLAMGHRRLSIMDLSAEGHQPMHSQSGRYIIVFNGEIYNYKKIREALETECPDAVAKLRGHSDTEIMLLCIERWGLERAIQQFVGMFSLALWDRERRVLHLARDRMGEKPLYYGWNGNVFFFGSELKAIKAHSKCSMQINRDALTLYLRHNYIPAPYSIYSSMYKLKPGSMLSLNTNTGEIIQNSYWTVEQTVNSSKSAQFTGGDAEAVEKLDSLLKEAVSQQMVADVPLGAFLSGGIDSSAIVALMQSQSAAPIKTFTIGFYEKGYNEAEQAKEVSRHLGTDHTELYVTPREAMDVIPLLPSLYDEPFSDSSQIPTYLVSQLAKRHVTVSLSGDGGDELFGGYGRYFKNDDVWRKISSVPYFGRKGLSKMIRLIPQETWNKHSSWLSPHKAGGQRHIGDKMYTLAELLSVKDSSRLYRRSISHWQYPESVVIGGHEPVTVFDSVIPKGLSNYYETMMYYDSISYLPDDILVKVDRAGMGVSLESRIPMLDHRVVEFAWRLPLSMKIRDGKGKWLLRQVLHKYVPESLMDRPKQGFSVPIDSWLRGPMREWAEHLIDEDRLNKQGYFQAEPIRRKWTEHLNGTRNWHGYLWDILMFQAWLEEQAK